MKATNMETPENNFEEKDLLENYEELPQEVQDIIGRFEESDYTACENLVKELEAVGYTCDYSLDASPFDLKKIN